MLDITEHKKQLVTLFLNILDNRNLSTTLGFKGGTALYLFYDLDRFSTDLDFNRIEDSLDPKEMTLEIEKSLKLIEYREKRFTHFWLCSYQKGQHKIKVEVNKREFSNDRYEIMDFRGYSCKVLDKGSMFAHKLCAITERNVLQNRDLYDSWFMFSKDFPINEDIIEERLAKSVSEYCEELVELIDNLPNSYKILNGLGSVLDNNKREWVKQNLLKELRKYLISNINNV
jgi:predicted nucleotidyltransferase component of viral defense system